MYTNVPKPTGASYTKLDNGYPLFDDADIFYDDSSAFFDGFRPLMYTNISKPTSLTWATATIPWSQLNTSWDNAIGYTNVSKPT